MNGKELKKILKDNGVVLAELAREAFDQTPQWLNSALNAKKIKRDFLQKVEEFTKIPLLEMENEGEVPYYLYLELKKERDELLKKIAILEYKLNQNQEDLKRETVG